MCPSLRSRCAMDNVILTLQLSSTLLRLFTILNIIARLSSCGVMMTLCEKAILADGRASLGFRRLPNRLDGLDPERLDDRAEFHGEDSMGKAV